MTSLEQYEYSSARSSAGLMNACCLRSVLEDYTLSGRKSQLSRDAEISTAQCRPVRRRQQDTEGIEESTACEFPTEYHAASPPSLGIESKNHPCGWFLLSQSTIQLVDLSRYLIRLSVEEERASLVSRRKSSRACRRERVAVAEREGLQYRRV
ncbi:MAG: hypothetical protein JWM39_16 [Parcubacteria group bacterium]|nr:hypothetical protein [Parcubacteria group bacterium]